MKVSELIKNLSRLDPDSEILVDLWQKNDISGMAKSLEIALNDDAVDSVFWTLEDRLMNGKSISIDTVEGLIYKAKEDY